MKRYVFFLSLPLLLLTIACKEHPPKESSGVETVPEVSKPLTHFWDLADTVENFESLYATFTCEARGLSANGVLRIQRDSIIWCSVSKIIELARVRLTPDSVCAYMKPVNRYLACRYEELQQAGLDIDYATIESVLTGGGSHKPLLQVEYDDFDTINGMEIPTTLDVTLNDKRLYTTAVVHYRKLLFDQAQSYPFAVPRGATPLWMPGTSL